MDNLNYINRNNPNAAKVVQEIIEAQKWSDYWRVHNQKTKKFTWSQKTPPKYARLDFFLINKPKIEPKWKSDHGPISINISLNNQQRGRGVWKFNNGLLINKEFNKIIKEEIKILKTIYAATPYNPEIVENLPNKDLELTISFTLFLETGLTVLTGKIIKFSAKKKAEAIKEEKDLMIKIEPLEDKELKAVITKDEQNKLDNLKDKLEEIRKVKLKGTMIRSRARWVEFGEKSSKYFLNLEKRNFINKSITELKTSEDKVTKDQNEIINMQKNFYKSLYEEKITGEEVEYTPDISNLNKRRTKSKFG